MTTMYAAFAVVAAVTSLCAAAAALSARQGFAFAGHSFSAAGDTAAASGSGDTKPSIVLVHGAFADASSWLCVIPLLTRAGYAVTAVQIEDVATTKRVIDAQGGPVVVVGHSYGGAVISGAAAGSTKVSALVFIAAFAPEANEPIAAFSEKYPSAMGAALRPDAAGFLYIDRTQFHDVFAKDLGIEQADVMAATQKPIRATVFGESVTAPAWKSIPSWYLVSTDDQAINPDLERFYARRMGATTREIKASHVPFLSHPESVAAMIMQAASAHR